MNRIFASFVLLFSLNAAAAPHVRVLTLNVWLNGSKVENGLTKLAQEIVRSQADVIFLQEADGAAAELAARLKLNLVQGPGQEMAVLTSLPVSRSLFLRATAAATVETKDGALDVASMHLPAYPYGPYLACFENRNEADIAALEEKARMPVLRDDLRALNDWNVPGRPLILGGDLNTPSHLDWIGAAGAGPCARRMAFPVTVAIESSGFHDAYRTLHPDPVREPGLTWSTVEKWNDEYHAPEPQDRIDFIFYRELATPTAADVFRDDPSAWPSDHSGVLAHF